MIDDVGLVENEFQNHVLLKALILLNGFIINYAFRSDGLRTVVIGTMSCELKGKHAVVGIVNKQSDCGCFWVFFGSGYFTSCEVVYDLLVVEKVKKSPSDFLKRNIIGLLLDVPLHTSCSLSKTLNS